MVVVGAGGGFNSRIACSRFVCSHSELEWKGALVWGAKGASAQVSKDYVLGSLLGGKGWVPDR